MAVKVTAEQLGIGYVHERIHECSNTRGERWQYEITGIDSEDALYLYL